MKYRWIVLLLVPFVLLALSSTSSRAQSVPTPNASVSALQTQAAQLSGELPGLRSTEQAARNIAAAAVSNANHAAGAVQNTQNDINNTNAAINAGLGRQALELAGRSQDSLNSAQATLTSQGQAIWMAVSNLDQAAAAYQTAVPRIVVTAQAVVQSAAAIVPTVQAQAYYQARQKDDQFQSERTLERVVFGVALLAITMIVFRLAARARRATPGDAMSAPAPVSDRERLPGQPIEFVEDDGLNEYFSQSDHQ